jgi:hypothetical protein
MKVFVALLIAPSVAAGLVGLMLLFAVNSAFPLTLLWAWFLVPLGAPSLSVAHAMGALTIISLMRGIRPTPPNRESKDIAGDVFATATLPWMALLCGWIIKAVWL